LLFKLIAKEQMIIVALHRILFSGMPALSSSDCQSDKFKEGSTVEDSEALSSSDCDSEIGSQQATVDTLLGRKRHL
jgi:hypothetical protein